MWPGPNHEERKSLMLLKKLTLAAAVCALLVSFAQTASAQGGGRPRLRADLLPGDIGPVQGNSNFEARNGAPRKIDVQVQNVRPDTTSINAYILYADTWDFVYFASFDVIGGIGRVENEAELGQFVPQVRAGDYVILFDSFTGELAAWGQYVVDN